MPMFTQPISDETAHALSEILRWLPRRSANIKIICGKQIYPHWLRKKKILADASSTKLLKHLAAYDLLVIDELGYLTLKPEQANAFFKLMDQRYNRKATIITTNLDYPEWYNLFHRKPLVDALLDRLQHHIAHQWKISPSPSSRGYTSLKPAPNRREPIIFSTNINSSCNISFHKLDSIQITVHPVGQFI